MSLTTLTASLRRRFQQQDAAADLDEAVTLCQEALEKCPSGSVASAPPLHKLAQCLSERFTKLAMRMDLDNATIKYEQATLVLRPLGHPDRAESLNNLANCRQLRIKDRSAIPQPTCPPVPTNGPSIKHLIGGVSAEILKAFPPRLLDTHNSTLCDRDSQIAQFEKSREYNQLLSLALAMDGAAQVTHIHEAVSTYFQYVTLSHRWGKFEPLLHDIDGQVVYDLDPIDGLSKLQSFCLACCRHGYL